MIVSYNLDKAEADGLAKLKVMTDEAKKKGYTVMGLTASGADKKKEIQTAYNLRC